MKSKSSFVLLIALLIISSTSKVSAQAGDKAVRIGLKLPYTYDIGYYQRFSTRIGMHISSQIVTFPFSSSLTSIMNMYGADPAFTNILKESMGFGIGIDHGWHYYFGTDNRRYYVGLSARWMSLPKQEFDDKIINTVLENGSVDGCNTLDDCPVNTAHKFGDSQKLTINVNYVNIAITAGMTFVLYGGNEIRLEGEIAKTIASRHYLYSEYRYISPVTEYVNTNLQDIMKKYGWFPAVNVYYIYKLKL